MLSRPPAVSFGHFAFDPRARLLRREGVEVPLPPRVLGVLELLLARAGDIVPRRELMETVWKDAFVTDTSLAEAISFLRQALGDDPQSPTYIQTVHRRGYRFLPSVDAPTPDASATPITPLVTYDIVAWSIALLSVVGAVSAMWYATRQEPVVPPIVQMRVEAGTGLTFDQRAPALALSQKGEAIAWSACDAGDCRLFTRVLSSVTARPLEGTAGAAAPFFSPDERWIGFFADGKLKKVLVQGGPPIVIADAPYPGGGTWMADGRIVFAASIAGGLLRVNESGGSVETLTQPSVSSGELRHANPVATASGDAVTFIAVTSAVTDAPGRLMLLPSRGGSARVLVETVTAGALVGHEFVAYTRGQNLLAQPYHPGQQEVSGGEQVVASGVLAPHLAISANGALAYANAEARDPESPSPRWRWSGTSARRVPVLSFIDAALSPAGTRIAGIPESAGELWTADLTRGTTARVTHSALAAAPAWSADGTAVFYGSKRSGRYEIWMRDGSANGEERKVLAIANRHLFPASAAREHLAYVETGSESGANVGIVDLTTGQSRLVASTRFDETAPALSPDGERVAYQTNESGRWEVVLLQVSSGRRVPISPTGGTRPLWSADGRSLLFESRGAVLRLAVGPNGDAAGTASVVHHLQSERIAGTAADGALLLESKEAPPSRAAVLTLEWIRELRRTVGPPPVALPR